MGVASEYILGLTENQKRMRKGREFVVSAYDTSDGRLFYTQPINPKGEAKKSVRYRIRVRPKKKKGVPGFPRSRSFKTLKDLLNASPDLGYGEEASVRAIIADYFLKLTTSRDAEDLADRYVEGLVKAIEIFFRPPSSELRWEQVHQSLWVAAGRFSITSIRPLSKTGCSSVNRAL